MAIIVNTNMPALRTQANLNKATNGLNSALERMSTGLKINSAKDDAAGLYVATKMETQIRDFSDAEGVTRDDGSLHNEAINTIRDITGILDDIQEILRTIEDRNFPQEKFDGYKNGFNEINCSGICKERYPCIWCG